MIYIDVESYSELDVTEVGTYRYWEHPSTRLLVVCWAEDDGPVQTWTWLDGTPPPAFEGVTFAAHNAEFEMAALASRYRACDWVDTAAQAAMCGLPRGLGKAATALNLPVKKNPRGRYLIQKLSRPQRPSKKNPETRPEKRWPDYRDLLNEFAAYCEDDVEVCRALHKALPQLPRTEQRLWELTATMNKRGVRVDLEAVRRARALLDHIEGDKGAVFRDLTGGIEYTQRDAFLAWMAERGVELEALDKAHVAAALRRKNLPLPVKQALEIRQALAKSSTAKLDAILDRVCEDGRVRGSLLYHGAATGRWAGAGIQIQNFPRTDGYDMADAISAIFLGDPDWIAALYGLSPAGLVSKALRGMLIASEGNVLVGADFSAIEARGVLWLAGDPGLEILRRGEDIYVAMAADIAADATRQLGKQAVLGCGFGMGPPKFQTTCESYGMPVDLDLAKKAVYAYRSKFPEVPKLWTACEAAAMAAVRNPGKAYRVTMGPGLVYARSGEFLRCQLPSGRFLYYPFPEIGEGKYGPCLTYMGIDSQTKAWRREDTYGGKLVENVTQAVARDLMAEALLGLEAAGHNPVMTIHDEAVCDTNVNYARLLPIMCNLPAWAEGFPLAAEGFSNRRYS